MKDAFSQLVKVSAGFPSPAADYMEPDLDFNQYFKKHPSATFAMQVSGDCMKEAFIPHGSMVVIDRSLKPFNNSIVVATVDGEWVIKHFVRTRDGIFLLPANPKYKSMKIEEGTEFNLWGVVTHVVIDLYKV
jgi:DNA polymerase V